MYLVTGGAGFLGQHLVRDLVSRDVRVRSLDVLLHDYSELDADVEIVHQDICDPEGISTAVQDCDVVIHNAALVLVSNAGERFWTVNVEGTRNVLEAALRHDVRKVVFISTWNVFGRSEIVPLDEETPKSPIEAYGASKAAAEQLCVDYMKRGLDVTILRPAIILGTGRLGMMEFVFDRVRRGRRLFIFGSGQNKLQFVSASDVASACFLAATQSCRNEDFNLGAQVFGTLRSDLEALVHHAGTDCRIVSLPQRPGQVFVKLQQALRVGPLTEFHYYMMTHDVWQSTSKIQKLLGWSSIHSNGDVLRSTYDWYVDNSMWQQPAGGSPHLRGVKGGFVKAMLKFL